MFDIQLKGNREVVARFDSMPGRVIAALTTKVTALTLKLEAKVKGEKLSGQVLNVVSGRLRRSISEEVHASRTAVIGKVFADGSAPYGAIHEFGGKTAAHEIVATKAQALAFMLGGKQVFARRVQHPGSVMPERSYMRSSLQEMRPEIVAGLTEAAREEAGRK